MAFRIVLLAESEPGGGSADLYTLKIEPGRRGQYAAKMYGFSHMSVSKARRTLRHIAEDGRILHAFAKSPDGQINFLRRPQSCQLGSMSQGRLSEGRFSNKHLP